MVATVGSIEVTLKLLGSEQYTAAMRGTAAATESAAQRIEKSTVNAGKGADSLGRSLSNVSGSNSGLNSLALSALRADSNVQGLTKSFYALGAAVGGISGALAVKAVTNYADAYTNVQNKIAAVVSDSKERIGIENDLFGVAQRSRSSLESTVALYSRLRLASENLGASQKDILKVVEATQKAFVVGGSTVQEAASTATQLAQALGSGKLSGDEFRAISENAPILFKAIAKEFGVGTGDLKQMASDGELTAKRVFRAIINSAAEVDEAFARTTPTIEAGIQQIDNALTRYIGQADKSLGASAKLSGALKSVADSINVIGDTATIVGGGLVGGILLRGLISLGSRAVEPFIAAKAQAVRTAAELENIARDAAKGAESALAQRTATAARVAQHAALPLSEQADPGLQAIRRKEFAELENISKAEARLAADRAKTLQQLGSVEQSVANVGVAASNRLASAKTALAKTEETLAGLIAKRAGLEAAAEKAGQGTLRKDQQSYYNALYRTVDARKALDDLNAQIAQTRANIEQARASRISAFGAGDDAAVKRHTQEILQQRILGKQLADEQFARGRELNAAQQQQAAAESQILNKQTTERERAALAVAKNEEKVAAAQSKALTDTQRLAAAEGQVLQSRVQAEQKVAQQREQFLQKNVQQEIQARQFAAQKADVTGRIATTAELIPVSAAEERAKGQKSLADATEKSNAAIKQTAAAAAAADTGLTRLGITSTALAGSGKLIGAAFSGLVGILGGPLNATLLAVSVAAVAYEVITARSAATVKEQETAIAGLAERLRELQALLASGATLSGIERIADVAKLKLAQDAIERYKAEILGLFADLDRPRAAGLAFEEQALAVGKVSEAAKTLGIDLGDLISKFATLDPATKQGIDNSEALKNALIAVGNANPDFAGYINNLLKVMSALQSTTLTANQTASALAAVAGAAANARRAFSLAKETQEEAGARLIDEQAARGRGETGQPGLVMSDPTLRVPTGPEITQRIKDVNDVADGIANNIIKGRKDRASRVKLETDRLNKQYPGADPEQIRLLAEGNTSADKAGPKGRKPKKSQGEKDAETLAKKLKELDEEARASGLSALDEKVVKFAQSAKVATSDINQFIEAVTNKDLTKVPATMQAIKDGLEAIDAAKFGRKALDEFFPAEKLAHDLHLLDVAAQRSPEIAKNLGQLKFAEVAKNASDFAKDSASAIGDFALSAITDFKNIGDALDKLAKALEKAVLEATIVKPLEGAIKGLLGDTLGGGSSGGGWIGALLGKAFTGGGAAIGTTASLVHSGGVIGADRLATRPVPLAAYASAPKFHSGFTAREFPAILQYGEMVLTAKQNARTMRTMAGLASSMGNQQGVSFAPKITIVNNNGSGIQARPTNGPEGPGIDIIVDQIVAEKLATPGSASNRAVRQNLGGAQRLTRR